MGLGARLEPQPRIAFRTAVHDGRLPGSPRVAKESNGTCACGQSMKGAPLQRRAHGPSRRNRTEGEQYEEDEENSALRRRAGLRMERCQAQSHRGERRGGRRGEEPSGRDERLCAARWMLHLRGRGRGQLQSVCFRARCCKRLTEVDRPTNLGKRFREKTDFEWKETYARRKSLATRVPEHQARIIKRKVVHAAS